MNKFRYEFYPAQDKVDELKQYTEEYVESIQDRTLYPSVDVNYDLIKILGEMDLAYFVICYDTEKNELAGYCLYNIQVEIFNKKDLTSYCAALFIRRPYRGSLTLDFIKTCDSIFLKEINAVSCIKQGHSDPRIGRLLKIAGYKAESITWCRDA